MSEHDIADRARLLHQQGLGVRDIAIMLGTHDEQVRRWIASTTHDEAAAAHARAWQEQRDA